MTTLRETSAAHNGRRPTTKARLVVIGNGMAGARAVEEILRRGGGDLFDITVFGDEPYGNYNRILLSNVLAGADDADEIFLNPIDWYAENDIDLARRCPGRSDRPLRSHRARPTTARRCATTGSSSPPAAARSCRPWTACGPTTKP